jgi:hypothetical protein
MFQEMIFSWRGRRGLVTIVEEFEDCGGYFFLEDLHFCFSGRRVEEFDGQAGDELKNGIKEGIEVRIEGVGS